VIRSFARPRASQRPRPSVANAADWLGEQVGIVYLNSWLCLACDADDAGSWGYRAVKRIHIIIHILRCMVGM
jgi:hypothetical protein